MAIGVVQAVEEAHIESIDLSQGSPDNKNNTIDNNNPKDPDFVCSNSQNSRTSWVDATLALSYINKGQANGNSAALWVRKCVQDQLYQWGEFADFHAGKVIFVAVLVIATFCVALKSAQFERNAEKLWVEEGGRLEKELSYVNSILGEGSGTSNQIVIHLPGQAQSSVLSQSALLAHLRILKAATSVTVDLFDISWKLSDLCYANNFPYFHNHLINEIFDRLTPCVIITPLDCFWEGSKLLGPEFPVTVPGYGERVKWTNLNPQKILKKLEQIQDPKNFFPFSTFKSFMKSSGVSTAYQRKPCLNPDDAACPEIAPNKKSKEIPNVGVEVTGGCYGFAGKLLHWPEEFIVGGAKKNGTGHIISASALQSIVQLMGPKYLFEHWRDHYKVHHLDWTQLSAGRVLDAWAKKFSQKVEELSKKMEAEGGGSKSDVFLPFTSNGLLQLVNEVSFVPIFSTAVSVACVVVYMSLVYFRSDRPHHSRCGLSAAGVLLVVSSIAAGLGVCTLLGLPLTALTTQLLPFVGLGLGVGPLFAILDECEEVCAAANAARDLAAKKKSRVGEVLKRCGVSLMLTSACKASAFLAASVVPVMVVRVFCFQVSAVILMTSAALVAVFPALLSLDLRRRDAVKLDILCCFPVSLSKNEQGSSSPYSRSVVSFRQDKKFHQNKTPHCSTLNGDPCSADCLYTAYDEKWVGTKCRNGAVSSQVEPTENDPYSRFTCKCVKFPSSNGWALKYSRWLNRGGVRTLVVACFVLSVLASIWGVSRIEDGFDLTDIVSSGSSQLEFLKAQQKYFGFYNIFAVTQGDFEYPTQQKLLHEYHDAFTRVPWIIKNDDGGLPDSWLILFRDWLLGLQKSFDGDWSEGLVTEEGWTVNASDRAVLAYKLLAQTGHIDHPVDRGLVSQARLVDSEGIINPKAFYNYLSAWVTNDALAYSSALADLRPTPRTWVHVRSEYDLKIPKSSRLTYAQFPFYVHDLPSTSHVVEMIQIVRDICERFHNKGLPNFPLGLPFTFWEQYIHLRFFILVAFGVAFAAIFSLLMFFCMSLWSSVMTTALLTAFVLQATGLLGGIGMKISALPAALVVGGVGVCAEHCVHLLSIFLTREGDRRERVSQAMVSFGPGSLRGFCALALSVLPLTAAEWPFVRWYIFATVFGLAALSAANNLLFVPVLLSLAGPPPLFTPLNIDPVDHPPTPPVTPLATKSSDSARRSSSTKCSKTAATSTRRDRIPRHSYQTGPLRDSNLSLTTITEEDSAASSCSGSPRASSHEILVEPQFVIETTTYDSSDSCQELPPGRLPHDGLPRQVTKVTATAKVKVELHNKQSLRSSRSCRDEQKRCQSSTEPQERHGEHNKSPARK